VKAVASILFVDDDAAFRRVLGGELERVGFKVFGVGTGAEAVATIVRAQSRGRPARSAAARHDGLEVLQAIRHRHPASDVIMLTGHGHRHGDGVDPDGCLRLRGQALSARRARNPIQRALERQALRSRASLLERGLTPPDVGGSFVGASRSFAACSSSSIASP